MANKTKRTPKKEAEFLYLLSAGYSVAAAANQIGIGRQTAYVWRAGDPDLADRWSAAIETGTDILEDEARRRALEGVAEPIHYQGKLVTTVQKYSDTLLIFLLKGRRPDKFAERSKVEHSGRITSRVDLSLLNEKELSALERLIGKAAEPAGDTERVGEKEPGTVH